MHRIAVLLALLGGTLAAGPALAQLGAIFGDSPPRPPANVPNGSFPPQPPPVRYSPQSLPPPAQYPPQSSPPPDRYPAQALPSPAAAAGPPPSGIQAQPLPPPPGATSAPAVSNRAIAPQTGSLDSSNQTIVPLPLPPGGGARLTPPGANPPPQQPDTPPPPDDTVITEMPTQKIENSRAVFSGLDKITGRIISFDAAIGETVQFGALQVTARVCYTRPPTEATNTDAFVQVDEVTLQGEVKRIFSGLDVRRQSGPPCGRASHLRCLADRLRLTDQGRRTNRAANACPCAAARIVPYSSGCAFAPTARARCSSAAALSGGLRCRKPCKCNAAGNWPVKPQRTEIAFAHERGIEQLMVGRPRHLDGAERSQMLGDELSVEQAVMASSEPGHEMYQRDLGGITGAVNMLSPKNVRPRLTP